MWQEEQRCPILFGFYTVGLKQMFRRFVDIVRREAHLVVTNIISLSFDSAIPDTTAAAFPYIC